MKTAMVDLIFLTAATLICVAALFFRTGATSGGATPSELVPIKITAVSPEFAEAVRSDRLAVVFLRPKSQGDPSAAPIQPLSTEWSSGQVIFVIPKDEIGVVRIALTQLPSKGPLLRGLKSLREKLQFRIEVGSKTSVTEPSSSFVWEVSL